MKTLQSARAKLDSALTEYANACTALANYRPSPSLNSRDLCNGMDAEIEHLTSFEERIVQTKIDLSEARNSLWVPVNSLPNEILNRIFHFVISAQASCFDELVDGDEFPTDNLAIFQVCTRWRRLALDSKNLWTHISLSARSGLIPLGKLFATRSGDLPLSVRVVEPLELQEKWDGDQLVEFFEDVGPRLETIDLAFSQSLYHERPKVKFPALRYSLRCCTPGQLTQLVISDRKIFDDAELPDKYYNSSMHWFIVSRDSTLLFATLRPGQANKFAQFVQLNIPQQRVDDILLPVKILKLDQIYPIWTSKAYHGLVELRLTGPRKLITVITEQGLANILTASPGLRVLQFGLEVSLDKVTPAPVRLEELEVFLLQSLSYATKQAVLRMIMPGAKPLQMATTYNEDVLPNLPAQVEEEFCRFFRRSSIVKLQVHSDLLLVQLPQLLALLPELEVLILRQVSLEELNPRDQDDFVGPLCSHLHSIHLLSCEVDVDAVRWVVGTHDLQKVTIWNSSILGDDDTGHCRVQDCRDEFTGISPPVHILDYTEDDNIFDIEGWDRDMEDRIAIAAMAGYVVQ